MRRISEQPAVQTSHLPQPERVVAEDVTLAAKVCFASFSRHVDLLEPLVEPRLAAAMRSVVQQEQSHRVMRMCLSLKTFVAQCVPIKSRA